MPAAGEGRADRLAPDASAIVSAIRRSRRPHDGDQRRSGEAAVLAEGLHPSHPDGQLLIYTDGDLVPADGRVVARNL